MKTVKILDKEFSLSINAEEINNFVTNIAEKINKDYENKNPIFLVILNGSFMFASDLFKKLKIQCEVSFLKVASYQGTNSTGKVNTLIGLNENIKGRSVVIIEDIVDTGHTVHELLEILTPHNPEEIKICTLLFKPNAYKMKIKLDYVGIEIPNDFIVGYGLDYDGFGRNLGDIYKIIE